MLLALVGGFLDAYTYIGRGGVFCNAQTGNIVLLCIAGARGRWFEALAYLPPILAFMFGVFAAEAIKHNSSKFVRADWAYVVIVFEIAVLAAIGFIPGSAANVPVTIVASFAASLQVSSFGKLVDASYATTMSTGNLRSASQATYLAIVKKDHQAKMRAIRYYFVIFAFMFGALLGSLVTLYLGIHGIWFAAFILACACVLLVHAGHGQA
jgi:uncharacterized membrane protein YoaK (UPF0700 family)